MLVLTRKESESIDIPEFNIRIHFDRVRGGKVKVRFDAPEEVRIVRSEALAPAVPANAELETVAV